MSVSEQQQAGLMTVPADETAEALALEPVWRRTPGLLGWLASTNHKDIGMRYIVTAFGFFLLAGVLAMLMRLQLALPENPLILRNGELPSHSHQSASLGKLTRWPQSRRAGSGHFSSR